MTHLHRSLMIVTAVGSLLLAACGSSSPGALSANTSTSSPANDTSSTQSAAVLAGGGGVQQIGAVTPCALLTQAEVDTAVGQHLGPGRATIPNYDCTWGTPDFSSSVSVTVSDWTAIKKAESSNGAGTPVPGVGDEALTKGGGFLYVRKGTSGFLLLVGGPHVDHLADHGLAAEKVLAAAVLGRL